MNDPTQSESSQAGSAGTPEERSDLGPMRPEAPSLGAEPGDGRSSAVRTFERPANAGRARPNPLLIILIVLILMLLAYGAIQVLH